MPRQTMTYDLAMAIGHDAASLRMRRAGRTAWNRADYNANVRAFYRAFGTTAAQYHRDQLAGTADPIAR